MNPEAPEGRSTRPNRAAVIVAHPDDETLWCGGTILLHPDWSWEVVSLCRASDADRAPKFGRALDALGASGRMADLDDGPEQLPLDAQRVENTILELLAGPRYDLVVTHSLCGEYTRHLRHEETGRAVLELWQAGRLHATRLWMFAYLDEERRHLPRANDDAHRTERLPREVWTTKLGIITGVYGFTPDSFEAQTCPKVEGFWCFDTAPAARSHFDRLANPT
jgi:LmbE family N-acetylglucosaminyl deacetylase